MKKTTIALDTNIWIYLTNDNLYELWLKFKEKKEKEEITIIINDIIILEWERNKAGVLKNLIENIKNEYRSAVNLSNYLGTVEKKEYLEIVSKYKEQDFRIKKAQQRIDEVETFMKSCTKVAITDEQKLYVSDLAISKMPPFHCSKNNYNDAILIINFSEYVQQVSSFALYDLIYVSNNPKDFIDPSTQKIYPYLIRKNSNITFTNVTELALALNLSDERTAEFDEWLDQQLEKEAKNLPESNFYNIYTS